MSLPRPYAFTLLLALLVAPAGGFAGDPIGAVNGCANLLRPDFAENSVEASFEAAEAAFAIAGEGGRKRLRFPSMLANEARTGKWEQVAERLAEIGIPTKGENFEKYGKFHPGLTLDLSVDSPNLLMRALRRLRAHWNGIKPGEFPSISIVGSAVLDRAAGRYLSESNAIYVDVDTLVEYLELEEFPGTLAHELRHAGFERFEKARYFGGKNFYATQLFSSGGALATSGRGYEGYASLEEVYTHFRDLRKRLLRLREKLAEIAKREPGAIGDRLATVIGDHLSKARGNAGATSDLLKGLHRELATSLKGALDGAAAISVPLGSSRIAITLENKTLDGRIRTVTTKVFCPTCAYAIFGRKKAASKVLREVFASSEDRLGRIDLALTENTRRLVALYGEKLTGKTTVEVLNAYDEAVRPIIEALQDEPRFGP